MRKPFFCLLLLIVVTISAIPVNAAVSFGDVKQDDWFYTYVTSLADAGAISGYPDGTFRPNDVISRAEFTSIVLNTMGVDSIKKALKAVGSSSSEGDFWAKPIITAANHYGITRFGNNESNWSRPITRAEMAYVGINGAEILGRQTFSITEGIETIIADWDRIASRSESREIMKAYSGGILVGKDENGTFAPDGTATRAEACVIIMRLIVPSLREKTEVSKK